MTPPGGVFNAENPHHSWDRATLRCETAADGTFTTYYVNDLTRSQTQDGITNTYELDSMGRQRMRTRVKGEEESTEIYHYANGSDSPSWIDEGEGQWTRFIGGIGASAIEKSVGEKVTLQLADMHGDIVATADIDPEATELLSTQQFDEYGNPKQKLEPDLKLGWLGSKMRRTELPSGVIQMGVRSYVPAMGRFTSVDPVLGGSANAYEYAAGDPVNNFDLDGRICLPCAAIGAVAVRMAAAVLARRAAARAAARGAARRHRRKLAKAERHERRAHRTLTRNERRITRSLQRRGGSLERKVGRTRVRFALHRHAGGPHRAPHIQINSWLPGVKDLGSVIRSFRNR